MRKGTKQKMPAASVQKYSIKKYRENGQTLRMLFLWRGSVYRMVWNEVIIWVFVYYALNMIYRYLLGPDQKKQFELIVSDVETGISFVPLSFVLGFYVQAVVRRYWSMWENLPWPDTLALRISATIQGKTARDQQIRRTSMRQIILSMVLALRKLSRPVKENYPSLESLVDKGLLMPDEKELLENTRLESPPFWMPLLWVASSFETARREGRIKDDYALGHLTADLASFRNACGKTLQVDLIGIPLAYSQVVVIACYTFYLGSMIARQAVDSVTVSKENYFPFFTILQLVIFIGWLSVAESMIHPFGEDDDDFELNWLIDRHINVTYLMVDVNDGPIPQPREDPMWHQLRDNATMMSSTRSGPPTPEKRLPAANGSSNNGSSSSGNNKVFPGSANNHSAHQNVKLNVADLVGSGGGGGSGFDRHQRHLQPIHNDPAANAYATFSGVACAGITNQAYYSSPRANNATGGGPANNKAAGRRVSDIYDDGTDWDNDDERGAEGGGNNKTSNNQHRLRNRSKSRSTDNRDDAADSGQRGDYDALGSLPDIRQ